MVTRQRAPSTFSISRTALLLVIGTIIFVVGFFPLALVRLQTPTNTITTLTADGVHIAYDVTMASETALDTPVAILLHGFSGNRIMMRMIALALAAKGFICASIDLRGHGSSEGLVGELDDFTQDVTAVIQSLQAEGIGDTSRIVLIGHSMGGGVSLNLGSQLVSAMVTIGVAPVASPDWVNTTHPRNLLLIISTGDAVIDSTSVEETFYKSVNATLRFNEPFDINGTRRELLVVSGPNHLNILYDAVVIDEIVKWTTRYVLDDEQSLSISPPSINVAMYVSLTGGTTTIIFALALAHSKMSQEKRKRRDIQAADRKALLATGLRAILLAGVLGSPIAIVVSVALSLATPLFFTNFVTGLFLGNSIVLGFLARARLRRNHEEFSFLNFIKDSIKTPSLKIEASLGIIGALAFVVLFALTLGTTTTATLSTASTRLISLPLYTFVFAVVIVLYESFFKGLARSMTGNGTRRMASSVFFELVVLFLAFLLELVILATVLSLFMPFVRLGFFVLGLDLVLIPLFISVVSAEVFYEKTGGWIAQTIISAVIFATLTVVFSPALRFF